MNEEKVKINRKEIAFFITGLVILLFGIAFLSIAILTNTNPYIDNNTLGLVVGPLYAFDAVILAWMLSVSRELGVISAKLETEKKEREKSGKEDNAR
jgi:uncharacterized membrane protein YqjE